MSQQNSDPKELAKNLRKPEGEQGIKIGEFMNKGNANSYHKMIRHLNLKISDHVLEIGFGNGVTSKEIMTQCQYSGLDYSSDMVKEATVKCADEIKKGAQLFLGDIHKMPFADNSFDKVFTINTVYFWDKPEQVLSELRRVIKEGGELFIGMRTKEDMEQLHSVTQHNFILRSMLELEELLRKGGFSDVHYTVYSDPLAKKVTGEELRFHSVIVQAK